MGFEIISLFEGYFLLIVVTERHGGRTADLKNRAKNIFQKIGGRAETENTVAKTTARSNENRTFT